MAIAEGKKIVPTATTVSAEMRELTTRFRLWEQEKVILCRAAAYLDMSARPK